jgi:hypothetical protein
MQLLIMQFSPTSCHFIFHLYKLIQNNKATTSEKRNLVFSIMASQIKKCKLGLFTFSTEMKIAESNFVTEMVRDNNYSADL